MERIPRRSSLKSLTAVISLVFVAYKYFFISGHPGSYNPVIVINKEIYGKKKRTDKLWLVEEVNELVDRTIIENEFHDPRPEELVIDCCTIPVV